MVLLVLSIMATTAPSADAYVPGTGTASDDALWANRDQVARFLAEPETHVTPAPSGLPNCNTVCTNLHLSEHRPMPGQPASKTLWRDFNRQAYRARARELLRWNSKTLPARVSLAATAALVGWQIGTALRPLFYGEERPGVTSRPTQTVTITGWQPVWEGETIASAGSTQIPAPSDGYRAIVNTEPTWETGCAASQGTPPIFPNVFGVDGAQKGQSYTADSQPSQPLPCWNPACQCGDPYMPKTTHATAWFIPIEPTPFEDLGTAGETVLNPTDALNTKMQTWPAGKTWTQIGDDLANDLIGSPTKYPLLRQSIDHAIDPTKPDPLATEATMPSCDGMTYSECVSTLRGAGFLGTITQNDVGWSGADLAAAAGRTLRTSPAKGTQHVPLTDPLRVDTNPDPAHMPVTAPNWVGQPRPAADPGVRVTTTTLPDDNPDTRYGPNVVTQQSPAPGTRMVPSSWPQGEPKPGPDELTVTQNPSTATTPGESGWAPPAPPGIDFSPLNEPLSAACTVFPFGIPCYVIGAVGGLSGAGSAPVFTIPLPNLPGKSGNELELHLSKVQPAVDLLRPLFLLMSFVGIVMWLGRKGSNNDAQDSD